MLRKTLVSLAAAAVLLGGWCAARAQEAKPLVTVAFSGYDELKRDIAMIGQLGDQPQMAEMLEALLKMATQGKGLEGLETSKPWGFVVQTADNGFPMYGFIPVTDLKKLLDVAAGFGVEAEDKGDGTYSIDTPGPSFVIKAQGGWAFLAPEADTLKNLPTDPSAALGDLPKKYDVAVRASIKNIPEQYKQMFISMMQMNVQMASRRMPGEGDEEYALRSNMTKQSMQQVITLVKELDEITLGFAIDQQTKTAYLDVVVTAIPGSKTAQQISAIGEAKTNFAGFDQPGAALTALWSGTISDADLPQMKNTVKTLRDASLKEVANQGLSDEELTLAKQILNDLFDVLDKTVDNRKMDGGMTVMLQPGAATAAVGGQIVDAAKLERILKQLVAEVAKEEPDVAKLIKFDAETHQGVRFHVATVPLPEDEDEIALLAKQVGNPLEVVVGVGDAAVYVAAGRSAGSLLKQIIDKSAAEPNKTIPPSRIALSATPIAKFVAAVAEDEPEVQQYATMLAGVLEKSPGKDKLTITSGVVPNGATVRVELEEGILKILPALMPKPGMGPGGPGGF